jgi:hypothetical protein
LTEPDDEPRRSDRGSAMIAGAIVLGALIVNFGLSSATPRYQLAGSGGSVVRMDNDSGEMIACNLEGCRQVQPPDRARTLRPVTNLIGGAEPADQPKQLPAPTPQ